MCDLFEMFRHTIKIFILYFCIPVNMFLMNHSYVALCEYSQTSTFFTVKQFMTYENIHAYALVEFYEDTMLSRLFFLMTYRAKFPSFYCVKCFFFIYTCNF